MARIARAAVDAAGREAFVAGDMGPCGQFVRPLGDLHPLELYEALREQARGLVEGGVDLFLIETQFDLAEVRIAVAAIRAESDLPIMVSMTFEQGTSLTGTTPEIFAETMAEPRRGRARPELRPRARADGPAHGALPRLFVRAGAGRA